MSQIVGSLIALFLIFFPVSDAEAVTRWKMNRAQCSIVRWGPDHQAMGEATWNAHYSIRKPVMITPLSLNLNVQRSNGKLVIMRGYTATLWVQDANDRYREVKRFHTTRDDRNYLINLANSVSYKALDYPVWRFTIHTDDGTCTTQTKHLSW